jgi:hypothetical protein
MSAQKIEAAVRQFSPEPVQFWCKGQSLESRYSARASGGGLAGAAGAGIGQAIMRRRMAKVRAANAELMPRSPVVALSASRIFLFAGQVPKEGPFAALQRDQVRVVHTGHLWHRLDLVATTSNGPRVYTVMVFSPGRGPKRLRQILAELSSNGGQVPASAV